MKRAGLTFIIFLLLVHAASPQSKTSKEVDGLIGPVHVVTTVSFRLTKTGDAWTESLRHTQIFTYDETGNDGRFGGDPLANLAECFRKYDDKGHEIERECGKPDDPLAVKMLFKYDEAGRVIEDIVQKALEGKLVRRNAITFDEKGNMSSVSSFDSEDKLQRKLTWTFDEKGNRAEWTESRRQGEEMVIFEKLIDSYDDKGNVVIETQYGNPEGTVMKQFFSYEFDARGNWIKRERSSVPLDSPELQSKDVSTRFITYYDK